MAKLIVNVVLLQSFMFGVDQALYKLFKNTNFSHSSSVSKQIVKLGETIHISNHVSKMGYNISGRKQILLLPRDSKPRFNGIETNQLILLTDKNGHSLTEVTLNHPGEYRLSVLFMNRKSGYYEHQQQFLIKVISPIKMYLFLILFFAVALLVSMVQFKLLKGVFYLLPFNWLSFGFKLKINPESLEARATKKTFFSLMLLCLLLVAFFIYDWVWISLIWILLGFFILLKGLSHWNWLLVLLVSQVFIICLGNGLWGEYGAYLSQEIHSLHYWLFYISAFCFPPYIFPLIAKFYIIMGLNQTWIGLGLFISILPLLMLYCLVQKPIFKNYSGEKI